MRYISTRGKSGARSFEDVLLAGLADDGGLYVPETVPILSAKQIKALAGRSYEEVAFEVMRPFIGESFSGNEFEALIARAYAGFDLIERARLKCLGDDFYLLELFHGPTLAFKDFAMQLIGQMFQAVLARRGERVTIIVATSGDTGAAAMEAFRGLDAVDLFILYPAEGVSDMQRRQMTTACEDNVQALAIDADFDTCQAHVKAMFNDHSFRDRLRISGVNSINWGRVLAQIVYFFTGAIEAGACEREIDVTVPTGNFGDIFAAYIARQMGLPLARLGIATNQNDILHRCLRDGLYQPQNVLPSISPAMDIQVSSNFERVLFDACGRDGAVLAEMMVGLKSEGEFALQKPVLEWLRRIFFSGQTSEKETLDEIARLYKNSGKIICTHTAVGAKVGRENKRDQAAMMVLATAHPAKFPDAVSAAIGVPLSMPPVLEALETRDERRFKVSNELEEIKNHIEAKVS